MADNPRDRHAGPGPELGEAWKERVAKFNELENARLDELENARLDKTLDELENARLDKTLNERLDKLEDEMEEEQEERDLKRWLEWYKKVGIHRDFARNYAMRAARMSC